MDTKFSVAIHILAMIAESKENLSSQAMAISVGTNASYIRKVIALLKSANLLTSHQGKIGYKLTKAPAEISLLAIYYATQEVSKIKLFQVHQHANIGCPVGKHIEEAVTPVFQQAENLLEKELAAQSLANVISNLYTQAGITR